MKIAPRSPPALFTSSESARAYDAVMKRRARILVVEDEPQLRGLLRLYLEREGHDVTDVGDGRSALEAFDRDGADLVILDLMLPGMQGETVFEALRDAGDVPVLITSAKRSDAERIAGLRAGADDYLPKPFNPHELTARVAAILRRTYGAAGGPAPIVSLAGGRFVLDPESRRYTLADGSSGRLTPGEAALVQALAARPGAVLGRQLLLDVVARRPDEVYERVVDVHVANLRRKLGDDAGDPWLIETVPASGYRLVAGVDPAP
jgi:two-component system, OmpR family, response regulator